MSKMCFGGNFLATQLEFVLRSPGDWRPYTDFKCNFVHIPKYISAGRKRLRLNLEEE